MGTKVTIVEFMPNIVPIEDEDISKQLARSFKKSGIDIMLESTVEKVDSTGDLCKVTVKTKKGEEVLEAEIVLSAVGITPNIENLGLEEVGIITDKGKVLVNDYYQTNIPEFMLLAILLKVQLLLTLLLLKEFVVLRKLQVYRFTQLIMETFQVVRIALLKLHLLV